jgi:hypothetical protein
LDISRACLKQTLTFADSYGRELHDAEYDADDYHDDDYSYEQDDDVSLKYDSEVDLPAPAVAAGVRNEPEPDLRDVDEDDDGDEDDEYAANGIEEHNTIVSDGDSTVSDNYHISEPDERNFDAGSERNFDDDPVSDDHSEAVNDQKEGVDDPKAGVDDPKAGVDNDIIEEVDDPKAGVYNVIIEEDRPANGPMLRPRGIKKVPTHILRGYGGNDFLFALRDADSSFSFLTEQMSMTKGLEHFQKKGVEALMAEMSQLHYRKTIKPVFANFMTREL